MYVSKYYTCEEIDQRLLQGYYDDFVRAGFGGTINEFWAFVLSIKNKVDKKEGYDLSKNDFTDELKAKLDGIEEHANYITKVSQLENDLKYQTEEEVKQMISDLVDGADDALDTLKELAEALGNDPNFATTITNKLTDLRTALTEEVNRAKEAEAALGKAHITVNKNGIPNDPQKPFVTSGIRIGSPAMTTRGFTEIEAEEVAHLIADVLDAPNDEAVLARVRNDVAALCKKFPVYGK